MPPRLSMRGITAAYGGVRVLAGVDLEVGAGEVHALLGENGAGKSTLLKVLLGVVPRQAGSIAIDGVSVAPREPRHASALGIAMIHQELSVLPHLCVADNIVLGRERRRGLLVDRRARDADAQAALALLQHGDIPLAARTGDLAPAQRQIVEIARALAAAARVLVLDEPTSSLDGEDSARLRTAIATLQARGLAIVWVSHLLDEVRMVASRATVLRDGQQVFTGMLAAVDDRALVRHMAGADPPAAAPRAGGARPVPVLEVRGLGGDGLPREASFAVSGGEILGIAGLCGAGRTELLEVLFGLRPRRRGELHWHGRAPGEQPHSRWQHGIGMLAEDRKARGLALRRSIADNALLPSAGRHAVCGWLAPGRLAAAAAVAVARLGVRARSMAQPVGELSGGNQQKVALARLLAAGCEVWLLDEPTRGIDVRSREEIHRVLRELAAEGAAVVVVSSQLPELLQLCDRIAVMRAGVLAAARPVAAWTPTSLLAAAFGRGGAP